MRTKGRRSARVAIVLGVGVWVGAGVGVGVGGDARAEISARDELIQNVREATKACLDALD